MCYNGPSEDGQRTYKNLQYLDWQVEDHRGENKSSLLQIDVNPGGDGIVGQCDAGKYGQIT